jgi:GrpB-like predicted nucleotidyltransferase (UPF0157 family)
MTDLPEKPDLPDEAEVQRRLGILQASFESGANQLIGKSGRDPVAVVEASPAWPTMYAEIQERLAAALGPVALRIEHVGSTSIPGIAAKPVIDVQVVVPDVEDEAAFVPQIEALGWVLRSREPGHRYFRDPAGTPRRVQVHVCQVGSKWEREHLLFRDYLRTHPERASSYETLKRAASERYETNRLAYTEAKGPFIEETLRLAEVWAADTGWQP